MEAKKNPYAEKLKMRERKIFMTPAFGWTLWQVAGHTIGSISYLSCVPEEVCLTCINYLTRDTDALKDGAFNLQFDAEGYWTGIVQIGDDFFSYDTTSNEPPYINNLTILSDKMSGKDFVRWFLQNAVSDFETDFDEWVCFMAVSGEEEDLKKEAKNLETLIKSAKVVLEDSSCRGNHKSKTVTT